MVLTQTSMRIQGPVASTSHAVLPSFQGLRISCPASTSALAQSRAPCRAAVGRLVVIARAPEAGIGVWGTKAGMTQIFTKEGLAIPATVIALDEGNIVTQVKTEDTDGYSAVQVGYVVKRENLIRKPELGHLKKAGAPPMRWLREYKIPKVEDYKPGQQLNVEEIFKEGDLVDVAGKSIGKGFQGSIKRWGMKRGLMTHGSKSKRQHGSIGASATPSRVLPGLKMAGQMGNKRVKTRKLKVLLVDAEKRAIVVTGCIPGKPGNIVEITPSKIVGRNSS